MGLQDNVATLTGTIWMLVIGPLFLIPPYFLYKYRNVYNLKVRGPYTLQVTHVVLFLFFTYSALNNLIIDASPNACYSGVGFPIVVSLLCICILLNAWDLAFRFRIAAKLNAFKQSGSGNLDGLLKGPDSWFVRNRRYITRKYMVFGGAILCFLVGLASLPVVFSSYATCEDAQFAVSDFLGAVLVVWIVLLFLVTRQFKSEDREIFNMRRETRIMLVTSAITAIAATACVFALPNADSSRAITNSIICAGVTCGFLQLICWPLWIAYHANRDNSITLQGVDKVATLADLLNIDVGYESFLSYARLEFAQENVLFWKAYDNFKRKYADASTLLLKRRECLDEARGMIQSYISDNSPSQVNLPADVRKELLAVFAHHDRAGMLLQANGGTGAVAATAAGTAGNSAHPSAHNTVTGTENDKEPKESKDVTKIHAARGGSIGNMSALSASLVKTQSQSQQTNNAFATEIDIVQIFTPAATEIYNLMVTDILPRYIRSEQFVFFVRRMKEIQDEMQDKHSHTDGGKEKHSTKPTKGDKKKEKDSRSQQGAPAIGPQTPVGQQTIGGARDDSKHSQVGPDDPNAQDTVGPLPNVPPSNNRKNSYMSLTLTGPEEEEDDNSKHSSTGDDSKHPGVQLARLPGGSTASSAPNTPGGKASRMTAGLLVDLSLGTNAKSTTFVDINEIVIDQVGHKATIGVGSASVSHGTGTTGPSGSSPPSHS